jgi:hypothetical protein
MFGHNKKRGPDTLSALHPVPKKIKTKTKDAKDKMIQV